MYKHHLVDNTLVTYFPPYAVLERPPGPTAPMTTTERTLLTLATLSLGRFVLGLLRSSHARVGLFGLLLLGACAPGRDSLCTPEAATALNAGCVEHLRDYSREYWRTRATNETRSVRLTYEDVVSTLDAFVVSCMKQTCGGGAK